MARHYFANHDNVALDIKGFDTIPPEREDGVRWHVSTGQNRQVYGISSCSRSSFHTFASGT
jgi:hypothetical protein